MPHQGYRSLPVVDGRRKLLGIITDGDLMRRAGLLTRLGLQDKLTPKQMQVQLAALQGGPHIAEAIMTEPVKTGRRAHDKDHRQRP